MHGQLTPLTKSPRVDQMSPMTYVAHFRVWGFFSRRSDGRYDFKKIFQAVLCSTQLFQWKLICTFNQHCLSYKISNKRQLNSALFFWKLFETVLHWNNFFKDVPHIQNTFKYIKTDTCNLLWAIIDGTLVIVYQINAPLWYKTTRSESDSRNFDCQWTLVSFKLFLWNITNILNNLWGNKEEFNWGLLEIL